ncbi:MAG: formyltransferase family protein [Acidimicrobiia bacterium]|nr:formyltransferase family protein [Acidimicrobiia bacterium]
MTLAVPPAHVRRLAYLGTPDIAVTPLRALHEAGFDVPVVITGADKRRGRGGDLSPTPVKAAAIDLGLPVAHDLAVLEDVDVDLGVVVAYGRIIPVDVLRQVPLLNMHFSLLPRWRGAAPVERALLAGDAETGVCLMVIDEELDTGAVYRQAVTPIGPADTLTSLRARLVTLGSDLLVEALRTGLGEPMPQQGEVTYASKIAASELEIDWTRPADQIDRLVRLGGAWTTFRDRRLKILTVEITDESGAAGGIDGVTVGTAAGSIKLVDVQPEGKAPMAATAWCNGAQPLAGEHLGS